MSQVVADVQGAFRDPTQPPEVSPEDLAMQEMAARMDAESANYTAEMDEKRRQHEIVQKLRNEYLWAKQEREKYNDRLWNELYRMYRLQMPDERMSGEWRSKINVPTIWNAVEGAVPHMMEGIFANNQPFRLKAQADDHLVAAHQSLINWELNEVMHIESEWEIHQRQKCLYGTSAWYTGFRTDYEKRGYWSVKPSDPQAPGPPEMEIKQYDVPLYVGPTGKCLDIYNIYPHPRSTSNDMPWVFSVAWLSKEALLGSKRFKNVKNLSESAAVPTPNQDTLVSERRNREGSANQATSLVTEMIYPIITKYDDVKKMVYSFNLYTDDLLEETPYPWFHNECPIVFDRVTAPPHEFWGVGFAEPILTLSHELNSIRNMRRDNENLTTGAMLEVKDGDIDDEEEELVVRPGGIVHSLSGNAVRFIQPPTLQDSYQAESTVKADIDKTSGLSGPIMGEAADGVGSASGNSLLQKAQLLRLRRALKNECECFKKVVTQILALNCQFLPLPEVFKVLGPLHFGDYSPLQVTALTNNATIIVEPAGIYEDENIQRQQLTNLVNVLGANPTFAAKIDWDYMLQQVLRLNGITDPMMALKKPGGIDVLQSMMAAEENMAMAAGQHIDFATPEDDYDVHMGHHREFARQRPDLVEVFGPHMYSHDMIKEQQIVQQAQMQAGAAAGPAGAPTPQNGPGSAPKGNGGGVNPNRQPSATNNLGVARQQARATPTGGR